MSERSHLCVCSASKLCHSCSVHVSGGVAGVSHSCSVHVSEGVAGVMR